MIILNYILSFLRGLELYIVEEPGRYVEHKGAKAGRWGANG